jgi:hypothetical protein
MAEIGNGLGDCVRSKLNECEQKYEYVTQSANEWIDEQIG